METPPLTTPEPNDRATPDAIAGSWVEMLPRSWKPYARLARADRPIGAWLLFWPCAWGVALAGGLPQETYLVLLFLIGSFAMRSAGCVYNDIVDRDLDASVKRTRSRPLASGTVSLKAAWALLVGLSLIGLVVLLQLGGFAQVVALGSLLLVAGYPFMKRITWWPQAWLGLTFNWGALVGFAAVSGSLPPAALVLYTAGLFWTLGYDTIYALQDIEDDALAGIKSSARRLGGSVRTGVAIFYAVTVLLLAAALWLAAPERPLVLVALLPAALHLVWQVRALRSADTLGALRLFRSNTLTGALVFAACLAAGL
ncbi:4-hydroxybenzoate octaprenyltransferase [Sphingosinicella xenopeptidilytica]|uniref:4-hydroxybenzoate octaprenyltransferase n=1 Tax=Sphingosinicella xenopeptidilytica TaxID=364098 RepID=A0ABW3BYV2_SPHXN